MARTKYTYNEKRKEWYTLVYDGIINADGSKHRKRISSKKSSADLEKKVNEFKAELEAKGKVKQTTITFGEFAQEWFEVSKASRELNTQRMYKVVLNSCFDDINDIPLVQITHSHFQRCINNKIDHPRTCQQLYLTFRQIIKSAIREHILPPAAFDDITSDISLPKYKKPQKRALTEFEKQAMNDADLNDQKRAFVTLLYYCGLRKSEALALTPDDFDWNKKTVTISKVIVFDSDLPILKPYPKSDNGLRSVPLPEPCISILKPYVTSCEGNLFKGQKTAYMTGTGYKRMWESIISSMNIALGYNPNKKKDRGEKPIQGLTAHIFRHNYCTQLCYQVPTISTKKIAQLMGDTEKMVLDVYSHINDDNENVSDALKNAF